MSPFLYIYLMFTFFEKSIMNYRKHFTINEEKEQNGKNVRLQFFQVPILLSIRLELKD